LASTGRFDEAVQQFQEVLRIDPKNEQALSALDRLAVPRITQRQATDPPIDMSACLPITRAGISLPTDACADGGGVDHLSHHGIAYLALDALCNRAFRSTSDAFQLISGGKQ
jgi:hypothetical protein